MNLVNRQAIAVLAMAGIFIAGYLLLYKLGLIPTVICGVGGGCETVQASRYAMFAGIPVAALGLAGYIAILVVALAGTRAGLAERAWVSTALVTLTGVAFVFTLYLSALEEWVIGAWCRWCIGSATVSTLAFIAALPEVGRLRRRRES